MNVLITSDWYAPTVNGVVTSVLNLRRELTALGHDVRVLTLSGTTRSYEEGGVTYIGAVSAGKIYPGARLRAAPARSLLQQLIDWGPDVIHSQCEFSTFLMAKKIAAATGAPIVHTYHTVYEDYTHYFSPSRRWGRRAVAVLTRMVVDQTDAVIAPTAKVKDILERYRVTRPVFVIPTGIDLRRFSACGDDTAAERRRSLGISPQQHVLLYVGRLAAEKNIEALLRGVAALGRQDVTMLLVGDGPHRAALEKEVRRLQLTDRVIFAGMVPPAEVPGYYRLGDIFVSASSSETQGLTYLEALAAGLPALCRKDPCLSGIIEDGVNGWQFQDDAEFLRRAGELLDDPALRKKLADGAAAGARDFSAETFARRAEQIYLRVAAANSAAA